MTYEEIVAKVKKAYAKADTALVDEHLAVQVDITGEGEGAFYIEVADGKITVEPYEYYDHDFKVLCSAEEIITIAEGKKKLSDEVELGNAYVSRNVDKVAVFDLIVAKKSAAGKKKDAAADTETTEKKKPGRKPAVKAEAKAEEKAETTEKKKPGRKPAAKKEAVAEVVAAVVEEVKAEVAEKKPAKKTSKK